MSSKLAKDSLLSLKLKKVWNNAEPANLYNTQYTLEEC